MLRRTNRLLIIQFAALRLVQSVELCGHKLHVLLPGHFPMPVCFHKQQQVFDVVFSKRQLVLRLGNRVLLCRSIAKHGQRSKQNGDGRHVKVLTPANLSVNRFVGK